MHARGLPKYYTLQLTGVFTPLSDSSEVTPFSGVAFRHNDSNDGQMDMINTPEIMDESCGV